MRRTFDKAAGALILVLLSLAVTGCSNADDRGREEGYIHPEAENIQPEKEPMQSEEQYADNGNGELADGEAISFDTYSGFWSYEGMTHEQILAEGGIELSCTVTEDNQFSGTLYSQQEITQRFASIDNITGVIEQAELYFDYADDEWGNSGTLHIRFLDDSIYYRNTGR